jgi:hypothetical protein
MDGFITAFWHDVIDVVELLLTLVPIVVAAVAKLASASASSLPSANTSPAKFSLFEEFPFKRRAKSWITKQQILPIIILIGSASVTSLGAYFMPMLDASSSIGYMLKAFLLILSVGGALLQAGIVLSLVAESLTRRYPNLELWVDTATGNGFVSLLCLLILVPSFRIFEGTISDHMNRSAYLMLAYSFSGYILAFGRLLFGVGLAIEYAAALIKRSRPK